MKVFNPHSVQILEMTPSLASQSSLLSRLPRKQKHRKDPPETNLRQEAPNFNQKRLHFGKDDSDALSSRQSKATLEEKARIFFKLAAVSDRRESRYNAHGNRASFHGQKHKLHKNVFAGSEIIDSMVASSLVSSREKALSLGNRLATELNLFSRANPRSFHGNTSPGHLAKPKGRTKANVLAAQTILLGMSDESKANHSDVIGHLVSSQATATEGCFIDDANAFYRFGPGVLTILRGIDDEDASHSSGIQLSTTKKAVTRTTHTKESKFVNCERDRQTKKKKGSKKKHEHQYPKRNLSITPNAPGCSGKIVLEDLFLQRHPEMGAATSTNEAMAAASTKASQDGRNLKVCKSGSTKKTKKSTVMTIQPSIPTPSPYPKSILKNSGSNSSRNKKKKLAPSKVTKNKTKGSHKNKIKAGAKIKYISEKERRIASIEKRLSVYHSERDIVKFRQMLKELKNRLSRLYTGDHFEIISLSSHSSFPPSPSKNHQICTFSTGNNVSSVGQPLVYDYQVDSVGDDDEDEFEKDDTFDSALDSLDDIISSSVDLLAAGDDNASVWTEFIMGTSNSKIDGNTKDDPKFAKPEVEIESAKKVIGSSSDTAKGTTYWEENPAEIIQVSKTIHNEEAEEKDKIYSPAAWQAPAPLESCDGSSSSNNRSMSHFNGNEIDLSSWAMVNRDRGAETEAVEAGDYIKNSNFPNQTLIPQSKCDTVNDRGSEASIFSPKNNGDSSLLGDGAEDEHSLSIPDDLSLFLEVQRKKEFQSHRHCRGGDGCVSKDHGGNENSSCHLENPEEINAASIPATSGTENYPITFIGAFQSTAAQSIATKDSNDLAKLRLVPHRRKADAETNVSNCPEEEGISDGKEAHYRDYRMNETKFRGGDESISESPSPLKPTKVDDDASTASDETNSGIMEAIENDPFYQQAAEVQEALKRMVSSVNEGSNVGRSGSDSSPSLSEPGSFTASYNDSHFQDSFDEFDGEEATIDTYSDEGSYMELTVGEEEIEEEEVIEEEIIEEDNELYEEVTVVSESNLIHNQSPDTVGSRPALSPRRKTAQFRSSMYLPSVPELGPEPEPEPEPQPKSPKRENSVYVEVHSMAEDDEMTQITMDCFLSSSYRSSRSLHIIPEDDYTINNGDYSNHNSYLFPLNEGKEVKSGGSAIVSPIRNRKSRSLKKSSQLISTQAPRQKNLFSVQQNLKQRTKYIASSSSSPLGIPCNTVLPTETSQQRIQEILWKDLPSSDVTVTWSALEELRIIVANESRSRAYLVRHGGVMVIIDTMAEQLEVEVIQFLCCNILEQLASVDFEIGLTILELGGVALIEQSTKKHGNSHRVKQMGDAALSTLLRNS